MAKQQLKIITYLIFKLLVKHVNKHLIFEILKPLVTKYY